jgi:hypothetical protein
VYIGAYTNFGEEQRKTGKERIRRERKGKERTREKRKGEERKGE